MIGWFNGQAVDSAVEWPEEPDEEVDGHHGADHHDNGPARRTVEGSAGPWVGLADTSVWPDSRKKSPANSWPSPPPPSSSYGGSNGNGNGNGRKNGGKTNNGKFKTATLKQTTTATTTTAPSWPPKPIVPQGGWADPSSSLQPSADDSVWPADSPAVQLHKKFHAAKNHGNGKGAGGRSADAGSDGLLSIPKVSSWLSDASSALPDKDTPWPTGRLNGAALRGSNGKVNGKTNGNHHETGDKSALLGWDQIPTGYAQKRPTWTKKKDHVIKFKESKFSQTDYTAPSEDKGAGAVDGAWVEDDEEDVGWVEDGVGPRASWASPGPKGPNGNVGAQYAQRNGGKNGSPKDHGLGGPSLWRDGPPQSWSRGPSPKHAKWAHAHHRAGGDSQGPGAGHHLGGSQVQQQQQQAPLPPPPPPPQQPHQLHHQASHHPSLSNGPSSLNNGWLDLQKELYLLKNKVRVSSSNGGWPNVGGSKDPSAWKQQWSSDQEPSSAATRVVTKVVFAESLPKGQQVVMQWTPPISHQVSSN